MNIYNRTAFKKRQLLKPETGCLFCTRTLITKAIHSLSPVQYVVYIYRYMKEWRKNPQWTLSCCLALFLPLSDLQSEIRGLAGRNILKQQLQTGKINLPSMSGSLKDSRAVNFALEETSSSLETDDDKGTNKKGKVLGKNVAEISNHDLPSDIQDTSL